MEQHQIPIYLLAILAGICLGFAAPAAGPGFEHAINPVLGALLYVTFLQVPAAELVQSVRDVKFLTAAVVLNFVVVPIIVAVMFVLLPSDQAIQIGVLLVLLCPCVDYVIVFTGLGGGDSQRLLASTPLLLIAQMALLPLFLVMFMGSDLADTVKVGPFIEAFIVLIVIPLALAWLTQGWSARTTAGHTFGGGVSTLMVPLMVAVLTTVIASQIPKIDDNLADVAAVIPVYVAFLIIMAFAGATLARLLRLDVAGSRAIVFAGATRNSLVVLPLALALPASLELAPAVVVTQTLVEIIGMVIYVRLIPRLLPQSPGEMPEVPTAPTAV
ncbi:bile acid:sodium symporter [Williamsia muralis]|nr:MAG: arsenic resistance protein [Gordonia sp. (in: high G+C Gram-positive bacteria)]